MLTKFWHTCKEIPWNRQVKFNSWYSILENQLKLPSLNIITWDRRINLIAFYISYNKLWFLFVKSWLSEYLYLSNHDRRSHGCNNGEVSSLVIILQLRNLKTSLFFQTAQFDAGITFFGRPVFQFLNYRNTSINFSSIFQFVEILMNSTTILIVHSFSRVIAVILATESIRIIHFILLKSIL